jgi:hypothetical protein
MGERSQDILARRSEGGGIMKIPISKLLNNTGQIEGVPTNPRTIDKADYQKLLKSIQEDPEYLDHEKPHDEKYVDVIRKRYWKFINDGDEEGWENGTKAIN